MNTFKTLSIFLLVLLLITAGLFIILRTGNSTVEEEVPTTLPDGNGEIQRPESERKLLDIGVSEDVIIRIADPRTLESSTLLGEGLYSLTSLENISDTSFSVVFNESNGSFAVSLDQEPLVQARKEAEQYLLSTLQVNETELCQLNTFVGVPYAVNQFLSGQNLKFSFCTNAFPLE